MERNNCVFCLIAKGIEKESILTKQSDVIFKNKKLSAQSWTNNKGHVILIPNNHVENIYDLHEELITGIFKKVKEISILIKKAYECDGITIKQNNESAGGQSIFHFHVHIIPRYKNDKIDKTKYSIVKERCMLII